MDPQTIVLHLNSPSTGKWAALYCVPVFVKKSSQRMRDNRRRRYAPNEIRMNFEYQRMSFTIRILNYKWIECVLANQKNQWV